MIDAKTLREMRQRAGEFARADEVVRVAAADGLYADQWDTATEAAAPHAIASARDVPRLLDTVELLSPAEYVHGPAECAEGDCEDGYDETTELCPHLERRVATFADVKRAELLGDLAETLKRAAAAATAGGGINGADMARIVVEAVDDTLARIARCAETGEW